jgi:hypothetical protein
MSTVKTEAEFWRVQLRDGFANEREIKDWADGLIAATARPEPWLIDASMATSKVDLDEVLRSVPGVVDNRAILKGMMKAMLQRLDRDPNRDFEVAQRLYDMYLDDNGPSPEALAEMSRFSDAIDLARHGVFGDRDEERGCLRRFLERWS